MIQSLPFIQVLEFGASRDGVPESRRGKRIVVNVDGVEINDAHGDNAADLDVAPDE